MGAASPDTFHLVNKRSGYCAEVNNGTSIAGELVDQWHCNGMASEQWVRSFVSSRDFLTYERYRHLGTGLCLDTVGVSVIDAWRGLRQMVHRP